MIEVNDAIKLFVYTSNFKIILIYHQPGQSFSFVARNVRGQELFDQDAAGANPIVGDSSSIL